MLEKYYKYKIDYKEYVLLFKYGNFYETFDNDAYIISKLFNYKLVKMKDTFRCGFPINSLSYVLDNLCGMSINFIVIDKDTIKEREFESNCYSNYKMDDNIKYNINSINNIIKYLNDNYSNIEINDKLKKIEGIINEG